MEARTSRKRSSGTPPPPAPHGVRSVECARNGALRRARPARRAGKGRRRRQVRARGAAGAGGVLLRDAKTTEAGANVGPCVQTRR